MGIQVKDSSRKILARMFNKTQLTVFALLVFACCVVIFPIHCDFYNTTLLTKQRTPLHLLLLNQETQQ